MAYLNGVIEGRLLKVLLAGVGRYNRLYQQRLYNKGWYKILELETVGSF